MKRGLWLLLWLSLIASPAFGGEPRVALVIGNGAYQAVPALPNPVNDAGDITASLRRLGFSVTTLTNANFDAMRLALIDFGRQARQSEIAVVFFAGHGMEINGRNYLIPVDAQLATDMDAANQTINLENVTQAVSNSSALGLVILDACRNNPFVSRMQRTNLTRAVDRGFVRIEPSDNVLVAYAAKDGTTASDGADRNSPFTRALLKNIETPGVEISLLFRIVRDDVMASTERRQQPFVYGSLSKEQIYLRPSNGKDAAKQDASKQDPVPVQKVTSPPLPNPVGNAGAAANIDKAGKSDKTAATQPAGPIEGNQTKAPAFILADPGAGAGFAVQVSSQRNESDAKAAYAALQAKYPTVLGSRSAFIQKVELGDKGVFFRGMIGPFATADQASAFCASLKSAGGQCVVQVH